MRIASLAAVCILAGLAAADESPTVLHVSPDGSDQNSGSRDKPFATPARARDAIRGLKAAQDGKLRGPVSVLFHGGTYPLDAPLVLTPQDSGTADAPVVYARGPARSRSSAAAAASLAGMTRSWTVSRSGLPTCRTCATANGTSASSG